MMLDILNADFHGRPLSVVAELKANFLKFAFEFLVGRVEFRVATGGEFFGHGESGM